MKVLWGVDNFLGVFWHCRLQWRIQKHM